MSNDENFIPQKRSKKKRERVYREAIAAGRKSFIELEAKSILTGAGDISIFRTDEDVEEIFGFKPKSHYKIIDHSGRNILDAAENVNTCQHLPASVRPFEMKIVDPKKELFMLLKRPCMLRYLWPPWTIFHQRALVYFPPDTYLGKVAQTFGLLSPKFKIFDTQGNVIYNISIIEDENSVWEIWSSNTKFQVQDKNKKTVGRIIKSKIKGRSELKGFKVGFLKSLDLNLKALIVASSFLIIFRNACTLEKAKLRHDINKFFSQIQFYSIQFFKIMWYTHTSELSDRRFLWYFVVPGPMAIRILGCIGPQRTAAKILAYCALEGEGDDGNRWELVATMEDWQNSVKCLTQRSKYLLKNQILCDCTFIIGTEKIKCHKLLLASASPVFYTMFYGQLPQEEITITDIEYVTFQDMLNYIYEDKLELKNYKHACRVYNVAQKYIIVQLQKSCLDYMKKCINHDNATYLYDFAKFYNEDDLAKHCLKEIQLNTSKILKSKGFCYTSLSTLNTILDLNMLNISSEMELISAIDKWAEFQSEKGNKDVANELVQKLRLLTVTKTDFFTGIADSGLLNDSEKLAVLMRIIKPELPPMENGLCEKKIKRKPCKAKTISTLDIQVNLQINEFPDDYWENIMIKVGFANTQDHFAEGSLFGQVKYNTKAEILFNTIPNLEPFKEYSIHIFLCCAGIYPIGKHTPGSKDTVEIDFLSHSSWESSHPWNTTVLSSIIYTDPL